MANSAHRLAILLTHPIQYFAPLFRRLAATPGLDLTVLYCSDAGATRTRDPGFGVAFKWDVPLLDGYNYRIMKNIGRQDKGFMRHLNPSIIGEIRQGRFDALVVHGHNYATSWLAFATARSLRLPVLMRGESHLLNEPTGSKGLAKRCVLSSLYRNLAGALPIGTCNHEYYRSYGFAESQLMFAPYSVDNDFFTAAERRLRPNRERLRAELGVDDQRPIILFCGKLVPKKQPLLLLEAFERIRQSHPCSLVYAGDGPLRGAIESRMERDSIPDVRIAGFLNQTVLPAVYAAADVFVLPSRLEPWGLVVNEAMNFGLPVVVSNRVGAAHDLVRDGENGAIVPYDDREALSTALARLAGDSELRAHCSLYSREIVRGWGLEQSAQGFAEAAQVFGSCAHTPAGASVY